MIQVRLLMFAAIAEACAAHVGPAARRHDGAPVIARSLRLNGNAAAGDVWSALEQEWPALREELARWRGRTAIAVNDRIASASTPLHDGDEVALLPPVSGG